MSSRKVMPSFIIKLMNLSRTLPAKERKILADSLSKIADPILDTRTEVLRPKKYEPHQSILQPEVEPEEVFHNTGVRNPNELAQTVQTFLESPQYADFPARKVMPLLKSLTARLKDGGVVSGQNITGTLDFFMGKAPTKRNFEDLFFSVSPDEQAKRVSEQMESEPSDVFGQTDGEIDPQYSVDEDRLKELA